MNSPLINYDLLYSPDIKKDNFKPKTLIQSSTTTTSSLLNPFKDLIERNMISLKNSNTHFTKPIFSPENLQKTTYPPVLNPSIVDLNNNALEKIKTSLKLTTSPFLSEKTNSKNNHNYECFKVFARIRPMNSKELSSININKKSTFLKTIVKLDETSVTKNYKNSWSFK